MASNALLLLGCGSSGGNGVLTPPTEAPVLSVTAVLGSYAANLSWSASNKTNSAGFGYRVDGKINSGSWTELLTTSSQTTNNLQGGATGETYYYRVTPYNDAGDGPVSNTVSVILPGESEAPVLTGWGEGAGGVDLGEFYVVAVNLNWNDIPGATYEIYRVENPPPFGVGTYSLLATTSSESYRDSTVDWAAGFPYYAYKVRATGGSVTTAYSNELLFTALPPPPLTSTYLRPNGVDTYYRPNGIDQYIRP
jgi:hypothetical protein